MSSLFPSQWSLVSGGITAPHGFWAGGISAGLKSTLKPDLALLLVPENSVCFGAFTQSLFRASCIDLGQRSIAKNKGRIRAVLINSGQANACTGEQGLKDTRTAIRELAKLLSINESEVLMCSTGVIGERIPMDILVPSLAEVVKSLSSEGGDQAAQAILTTDLRDKQIAVQANLGGKIVSIGGMAKGSGMIHPNMATMLGFITCDVGIPKNIWNEMLSRSVQSSFNAITVDGDTSTNDAFLAFNSGDTLSSKHFDFLEEGIQKVTQFLAKAIARDGEGANCLIQTEVQGANNDHDARKLARTVCSSSLVKTAIHGCDPNWGRIVAALGRSGIEFDSRFVSLWLGQFQLVKDGQPIPFDRKSVSDYMKLKMKGRYMEDDCISLKIVIGAGKGFGTGWGCDLSQEYIHINADYTT